MFTFCVVLFKAAELLTVSGLNVNEEGGWLGKGGVGGVFRRASFSAGSRQLVSASPCAPYSSAAGGLPLVIKVSLARDARTRLTVPPHSIV